MFKLKNLFSRKEKKQEQIQSEAQNIDKIAIDDFYSTCEKEGLIVEEITIDDSNFPKVENGSKDAEDVISGAAQIYKPRLTAPSKTDKNWIHYTAGGYNYCIKINGNSCLPNCFSGDTEVVTDSGIFRMDQLLDENINVMSIDGKWHSAEVKNFGKQFLYQVELGRNTYYATANHRWIVWSQSGKTTYEKTTEELEPGMSIKYAFSEDVEYPENDDAIRHGFIYGDGRRGYKDRYTCALLCGDKKDYMWKYFEVFPKKYYNKNGVIEIPYQLASGKDLPSITDDKEYLYNFIKGYFAADGCVDDRGNTIKISSVNPDSLQFVRNACAVLGIRCGKVTTSIHKNGFNGDFLISDLYLYKSCLTESFFINPKHRERFLKAEKKRIEYTSVRSVTISDRYEDVYCVVEPETHTFTLGGFEISGNCVGFAWGRWRELLGKKHNLSCSDAERWYGKNDGYKRGKTPKIGAVICWRKGRADTDSDGMGHVAIVEQVNQDGSVLCSNSAYYSTYFWLSTHKPPYSFGGYTFQGFIYNPVEYKQGRYIDEDGEFGFESTVSMQMWMGTEADGEISNQLSFNKEYFPAITTCKWGKGGSLLIKTFQAYLKKCGYNPSLTGYIDKKTVTAWQTWLVKTQGFKIDIDGYFGPQSAKAMQRFLNIVLNR